MGDCYNDFIKYRKTPAVAAGNREKKCEEIDMQLKSQKIRKTAHRFITLGEIMARLTPPDHETIAEAKNFQVHYGGSEANVALSLANLGIDASYFTVVPEHSLGKSPIRMLRANGVNCDQVIYTTPEETPSWRLGTYYLESGYGIRPSKVIYDRKNSAFAEYDFSKLDLEMVLEGYTWLHLSGITPALGENCKTLIRKVLETAKQKEMCISFDGNFRSALWTWEEARDFCTECLPYINVLFGIEPYHLWNDPEHPEMGDVKDGVSLQPDKEQQEEIFQKFVERYPNLRCIARHVREVRSSSENSLKAYLWLNGETYESKTISFQILDRVGGGDAFVSGIIYGLMNQYEPQEIVNFGVAASAIKHTIHGDGNTTDDAAVIRQVMEQNFEIKR